MQFGFKYDIRFVAIYLRKSRAESLRDLEKHKMILVELCKSHKYKYIIFEEIGTSDSLEMRPKMSKLLKEIEEGVYDAVCVVDYDRLSRGDMGDQDKIIKAFKKSETYIITPEKIYNLNDDMDDELVEYKGFMARREYKMITKRLRQGKKIGAKQGQWTNGTPPFPYVYQRHMEKYNEKGIVVHDLRLPIYREMIELALHGKTPDKIAVHLNNKGVRTVRGNTWSHTTIQRVLIDETHLGKIISNKSEGDAHKTKRPNAKDYKQLPRSEWTIVENCHEAVKTQEEHDKIIQMINSRTLVPNKAKKQIHAFTGLVRCAKCGHIMTFQIRRDNVVELKGCHYTDPFGNKCKNTGIKLEVLQDNVFKKILDFKQEILNAEPIEEQPENHTLLAQIAEREAMAGKVSKAIERLNDAYEMGDYSREQWLDRKRKREAELHCINKEIYELKKSQQDQNEITNDVRIENIETFFDFLPNCIDNDKLNAIYKTIIKSIFWLRKDNNIEINIDFW